MRFVFLLALVITGMWLAGWLTFRHEPGRLSMTVESSKIQDDAVRIAAKGRDMLDGATNELKASRVERPRTRDGTNRYQ